MFRGSRVFLTIKTQQEFCSLFRRQQPNSHAHPLIINRIVHKSSIPVRPFRPLPPLVASRSHRPALLNPPEHRSSHQRTFAIASSSAASMSSISNSKRKRAGTKAPTPAAASSQKVARMATRASATTVDTGAQTVAAATTSVAPVLILPTPVKSESDKKSYRVIQLPNGLKALLIADPAQLPPPKEEDDEKEDGDDDDEEGSSDSGDDDEDDDDDGKDDDEDEGSELREKLAAASLCIDVGSYSDPADIQLELHPLRTSLCIDVGSFSDPADIQGLAHFLEHMIFMGSAKYPSENEFDRYIKKHGGSNNACTNCEETQFYFEADESHLEGAMDRFASLFREPLMLKGSMQREREAVEAEFASSRSDDGARAGELFASLASKGHPAGTFGWGNMLTLRDRVAGGDDALYERVHEFRRRHYSAHRMYLCVQARWSLDQIQELVERHWRSLSSNGLPGLDFAHFRSDHRAAFEPRFGTAMLLMRPVAKVCKLQMTFVLGESLSMFRGKPHSMVAYLLGNEGVGSLCAYLRARLWALDLSAGVEEPGTENNSLFTQFIVAVTLTPSGLENVRHVYAAVLGYLRFLREAGPQERLFREMQQLDEINFRFKADQLPYENCEDFSVNLKYYPSELVFTADALVHDYEPEQIAAVLEELCAEQTPMNVLVMARQVPAELLASGGGSGFDRVEPWFGTEYGMVEVPAEWRQLRAEPGDFGAEFTLPPPNEYITTDFGIRFTAAAAAAEATAMEVGDGGGGGAQVERSPFPESLQAPEGCELWHRIDSTWLLPVAYYNFYLQSPVFRGEAKNYVLAALMPMLLKFAFVERLYPACLAGLGYEIYTSDKGLVVRFSGYNQHLPRLVHVFAQTLRTFADDLTEKKFQVFVEQKLRDYYNIFLKPKSLAKITRFNVIEHHFVPTLQKFECLKTVRLADFREFVASMLAELRIQALLQGNLDADEAVQIMRELQQTLGSAPIAPERLALLELRANRLPEASQHYVRQRNRNASDVNTVTVNYYQLGPITLRLQCMLDLLLLIVDDPCFDVLRTKEQLGYDVGYTLRDNYGVLGYTVHVVSQEPVHSAEHCDRRIEAFRSEYLLNHLRTMNDEQFGEFHATLQRLKTPQDSQLRDELQRNWAEVTAEEYLFNRQRLEREALSSIKREDFVQWVEEHLAAERTRKLSLQVVGLATRATEGDGENVAETAEIAEPESIFDVEFGEAQPLEFQLGCAPEGAVLVRDVEAFRAGLEAYPVCKTVDDVTLL